MGSLPNSSFSSDDKIYQCRVVARSERRAVIGRKKAKRGRNDEAWVMCATTLMVVVVSVVVIILASA